MIFWLVAAGLSAVVAGLIVLALVRARGAEEEVRRFDIQIYRDQLAAVDRDVARGTVTEEEAERLRTEIKRRILEADRAAGESGTIGRAPHALTRAAATVAALVVIGGSLGLYARIGAPNYADQPLMGRIEQAETARRDRPSQASAEADVPQMPASGASEDFLALMDRLRAAVESRPDDLQGHRLLARNEARLGNFVAAYEAQEQVIRIKGDAATAADYADYGDLLVLAAGGYVSPEAERAFQAALARDPANGAARYYTGLMFYQTGRPDRAFRIWREQLRQSSATAPWVSPIRAQIEDAARRAGIEYSLPPMASGSAAPGPSSADVEAAGEMTPSERMEMIEGMVSGLSDRLATEGGPPEEWARLIRALGVLGRTDRAAAIWTEAQEVFPDEATRLPILRAARDAGVAQ